MVSRRKWFFQRCATLSISCRAENLERMKRRPARWLASGVSVGAAAAAHTWMVFWDEQGMALTAIFHWNYGCRLNPDWLCSTSWLTVGAATPPPPSSCSTLCVSGWQSNPLVLLDNREFPKWRQHLIDRQQTVSVVIFSSRHVKVSRGV